MSTYDFIQTEKEKEQEQFTFQNQGESPPTHRVHYE